MVDQVCGPRSRLRGSHPQSSSLGVFRYFQREQVVRVWYETLRQTCPWLGFPDFEDSTGRPMMTDMLLA